MKYKRLATVKLSNTYTYINLQLTQIYKQHYANHNDVKFLYIWSLVVRCGN